MAADVRLAIRQQILHFAKYVNCENLGEVLLRGLEATTIQLLPVSYVMGWRQVVVSDSEIFLNCGYTYIHEDGLSEGQVLVKAHHYRMICDGVCIAISQRWSPSIIQKQVVILGRAQYVIIQEGEITWGLFNIYAPNICSAQQQFGKNY